jgi:transcription-repair coupling factor (superfamily II helicase)
LDEAIQELKETEFKDLFRDEEQQRKSRRRDDPNARHIGVYVKDTQIDTDLGIHIPDGYVQTITERLALYRQLDDSQTDTDLMRFEAMLRDRFGPLPESVVELIDALRLRWLAMDIGIEKLVLKNGKLICYFVSNQQSPYYSSDAFTAVLKYVQANPRAAKMKEANQKLMLTFEFVSSVHDALVCLKPLAETAVAE